MLETKIRNQASRLIELQNYKTLNENKIKQSSPSQSLPTNYQHSKKVSNDYIRTDSNIEFLNQQINELKNLLNDKYNVLSY